MILRDYQQQAKEAIFKEWEEHSSTLIVCPTGSDKTQIFASVIKQVHPGRSIVIAHREELIWQARNRIEQVSGLSCEVEMAELSATTSLFSRTPVVIATVQTLNTGTAAGRRMGRFRPEDFSLVVVDEAHHAVADSYKNVLNYFRQNPRLKVLGVTATPDRCDEEALGQVFDTVAFDYEILDAIHAGWLVPVDQQFVQIKELDFSGIRTTAGDLNGGDLAAVMEAENTMQGVASASIQIIGNRRSIVFTASVKQAEILSAIFNRHREGMANWVCGFTNKEDRRAMLEQFATGKVQVICNCGVLTEGFDNPAVEVIVMARPTKSRALYAQMAGRSLRPLPGIVEDLQLAEHRRGAIAASSKPAALLVDFVGNSGRHKLMTSADILGGKVSDAACERAINLAKKLGKPVRMDEALDAAEEELKQAQVNARLRDAQRKAKIVAQAKFVSKFVNPFDVFDIQPMKERGWDKGKVLSEKQRSLLVRQGINPDTMPFVQARQVIAECFRRWDKKLCSFKQAAILKRRGLAVNVSREEASRMIDEIALKEHWKQKPKPQPKPATVPF